MRKPSNCNTIFYCFIVVFTIITLFNLREDNFLAFSNIFLISLIITSIIAFLFMLKIKNFICSNKYGYYYSQLSTNSNESLKSEKNELELSKKKENISTDNIQFNIEDGIFNNIKYENGKIVINDINKPVEIEKLQFDFTKDKLADFNSKTLTNFYLFY